MDGTDSRGVRTDRGGFQVSASKQSSPGLLILHDVLHRPRTRATKEGPGRLTKRRNGRHENKKREPSLAALERLTWQRMLLGQYKRELGT